MDYDCCFNIVNNSFSLSSIFYHSYISKSQKGFQSGDVIGLCVYFVALIAGEYWLLSYVLDSSWPMRLHGFIIQIHADYEALIECCDKLFIGFINS